MTLCRVALPDKRGAEPRLILPSMVPAMPPHSCIPIPIGAARASLGGCLRTWTLVGPPYAELAFAIDRRANKGSLTTLYGGLSHPAGHEDGSRQCHDQ